MGVRKKAAIQTVVLPVDTKETFAEFGSIERLDWIGSVWCVRVWSRIKEYIEHQRYHHKDFKVTA